MQARKVEKILFKFFVPVIQRQHQVLMVLNDVKHAKGINISLNCAWQITEITGAIYMYSIVASLDKKYCATLSFSTQVHNKNMNFGDNIVIHDQTDAVTSHPEGSCNTPVTSCH